MTWRDVRFLVHLADGLLLRARDEKWSEEKYYTEVLNQFEKINKDEKRARNKEGSK